MSVSKNILNFFTTHFEIYWHELLTSLIREVKSTLFLLMHSFTMLDVLHLLP